MCSWGWFDEKTPDAANTKCRVRLIIAIGYGADDALRTKKRNPWNNLSPG